VAQFGHTTEYVQDIEKNPRVRVLVRSGPLRGWRSETAHILGHDDPRERARTLGEGDFWRRLCVRTSAALVTDLLTLRVDLDSAASRSRRKGAPAIAPDHRFVFRGPRLVYRGMDPHPYVVSSRLTFRWRRLREALRQRLR
jgi:hypothetical protein